MAYGSEDPAQEAPSNTALDQLRSAVERISEAARRTNKVRATMCGARPPEPIGKEATIRGSAGVFEDVRALARDLDAIADRINSDMGDVNDAFRGVDRNSQAGASRVA